jgi:hypothetical protein
MTKANMAALAAFTMALAGCDQSPPAARPAKPVSATPDAAAYRKTLLGLSQGQRNSVFFKAIAANNGACPEVKTSAYQEDYKDMSMWVVQCALTGDWAVFVNGAGFAQTRQCSQEKALGLPECKPSAG